MAFAELYEHAMLLDGLLTGKHDSETAQTARHQADVLNDLQTFVAGRSVYYLSDSGYSRIYIDREGRPALTSNSTERVRDAWRRPEAVEAVEAFQIAVVSLLERAEPELAVDTLNAARGVVPGR